MSDIHREFEQHLAGWRKRYAGRPSRELLRLYLLALEREENVAVAYSDRVLGRRLAALPVRPNVRAIFGSALRQIWADEEEHVVSVRAALRKLGSGPVIGTLALVQHAAGMMGGWTVAVRQHKPWAQAPLSRAAATLLLWAGTVSGRVPGTVRRHLDYCTFREFCAYNVHTEGTAWLCWTRLTELAEQVPALCGEQLEDFRRIADDEDRHRWIFRTLADALDDDDGLRADVSAASLAARLHSFQEEGWRDDQRVSTGRTSTMPQRMDLSRVAWLAEDSPCGSAKLRNTTVAPDLPARRSAANSRCR